MKKILKKMDLRISLLNFTFAMIHIIRKMLLSLKNHLSYLKENIFECFFKKYNGPLFFNKIIFFSKYIIMESLSLVEENIIKDIRNLFRLKKAQNYTAVKDKRNIFRLKKDIKGIKI